MKLGCVGLLEIWFPLDICLGVGLLDHMVALFLFIYLFFNFILFFKLYIIVLVLPNYFQHVHFII